MKRQILFVGTDGVRGKVPPTLTKADNQALGFKCDDRETFSFQNGTQYTNYTCFGKPPVPAGHGGDGGCGGFGGDPGAFHIIGLQNLTTHIKVVNRTGIKKSCVEIVAEMILLFDFFTQQVKRDRMLAEGLADRVQHLVTIPISSPIIRKVYSEQNCLKNGIELHKVPIRVQLLIVV